MHMRPAAPEDLDRLVQFERAMLQDMASYGGMPLAGREQTKAWLRDHLKASLASAGCLLLLASPEEEGSAPCGMLDASIQDAEGVFAPRRMVHIHALYVQPGWRKKGTGRMLLEAALEWGRQNSCQEAELNVLAGSPARALYESLGFELFEANLRRAL